MPVNAHPEFLEAEKRYLAAETKEQKITALKKMISHAPSHKGAENLRANLKRRLARLKYTNEKEARQKKSGGKAGIKKEALQAVIIGKTRTGKSSLLSLLTNASPEISRSPEAKFTTKSPVVGMMNFLGTDIQLIEIPAFESEHYDKGLVNSADSILILITDIKQIKEIEPDLTGACGRKIIIFNKADNLEEDEKRKLSSTLQSKKYNFVITSVKTGEGIGELKEKIFHSFSKIRVYTKEPGKIKSNKPIILQPDSTVKDVAEKILKGFSLKVRETKIWGPSSKFAGQKVGLNHVMKDLDVVEFKTK